MSCRYSDWTGLLTVKVVDTQRKWIVMGLCLRYKYIMPKPLKRKVTLACVQCQQRNYSVHKSFGLQGARLELKKFCRHCGGQTSHLETK